jgi:hypothetical protein
VNGFEEGSIIASDSRKNPKQRKPFHEEMLLVE